MAPLATRTRQPMTASGISSRKIPRVTSTQKLPSRSVRDRVKPRIIAIATARPTAAEKNCCTMSALCWVR